MTKKREARDFMKPCHTLGWCPYGWLVEFFPLRGVEQEWDGIHLNIKPITKDSNNSCVYFGHDCPAFYVGEKVTEPDCVPPLVHKSENDYVLNSSAWVERGKFTVWIRTRDHGEPLKGVIVEIYRTGDEDGEILDSASAIDGEEDEQPDKDTR